MKKKLVTVALTMTMAFAMNITALAGQWRSDANGWWWQNDDGSYPRNTWQWIDGNNDGIKESYYFDPNGYCLLNTTTPDGYAVNDTGAWTVNGMIQTQINTNNEPINEASAVNALNLTPSASLWYKKFSNKRTSQNKLWSEGFSIKNFSGGSSGRGYVEYFIEGAYSTFSFTMAPEENTPDWYSAYVEVYGDNDDLLWSSDTINYKSDPVDAVIDVSGQRYVSIHTDRIDGNGTTLLFKNVIFK